MIDALIGLLLVAVGVAFAANFQGVTDWHVRQTFRMMRPAERTIQRISRNRLLASPLEDRIRTQVRLERFGGCIFAVFGVVAIILGIAGS